MWQALKLWKLSSALKSKGNSPEAYSAVLELGRMGGAKATDLLLATLARRDGVARSAARELGRLADPRAIAPLAALLAEETVGESAAEALLGFGEKAAPVLLGALQKPQASTRRFAAAALGELRSPRAVEALIHHLQTDDDYSVRTAAATALGQLKDPRAIWVLVGTLKMRDETSTEAQAALAELRQAAALALRRIGDPLAAKPATADSSTQAAIEKLERELTAAEMHPRLLGEVALLTEAELVGVLKELITASEEISWAKLERREPILPAYFREYDQRRRTAETTGAELKRRGGPLLMKRVLEKELDNYAAINNWWQNLSGGG